MAPQCDVCFFNFDLDHHRPKCLPCGHTLCKDCVQNPAMERKCPTCRKILATDPDEHPDNIFVIRMIEDEGASSSHAKLQQLLQKLQRGVDAGRKVVQELQRVVPIVVEALNRQLDMSVAQLLQLEEALEREAAGDVGGESPASDLAVMQDLMLAVQLEDSLRLLTAKKYSVVAEEVGGSTWRASLQFGRFDDILHLLLLQLQREGQLEQVGGVAVPAIPTTYVGPPMISILSIDSEADFNDGHLKVDDILLRHGQRWKNIRSVKNLAGRDSEVLLHVVAPHLEELKLSGKVGPAVMKQLEKMSSLKRLEVQCDGKFGGYPDLPLQLEELSIRFPNKNQLICLQRMPRLRSLQVASYSGPELSLPPSQNRLLWLGVGFTAEHKVTMLSLIAAYASSLKELKILCSVLNTGLPSFFYFPDLGQDLGRCGLHSLRRLVLERPSFVKCTVAGCLLQRRTIRDCMPSSVDVVCEACDTSVFF